MGLLIIAVSRDPSDFILWFRPELVETALWAGDPAKPVTASPDGDPDSDRLSPRKSFEVWKRAVHNRALPWNSAEDGFGVRLASFAVASGAPPDRDERHRGNGPRRTSATSC